MSEGGEGSAEGSDAGLGGGEEGEYVSQTAESPEGSGSNDNSDEKSSESLEVIIGGNEDICNEEELTSSERELGEIVGNENLSLIKEYAGDIKALMKQINKEGVQIIYDISNTILNTKPIKDNFIGILSNLLGIDVKAVKTADAMIKKIYNEVDGENQIGKIAMSAILYVLAGLPTSKEGIQKTLSGSSWLEIYQGIVSKAENKADDFFKSFEDYIARYEWLVQKTLSKYSSNLQADINNILIEQRNSLKGATKSDVAKSLLHYANYVFGLTAIVHAEPVGGKAKDIEYAWSNGGPRKQCFGSSFSPDWSLAIANAMVLEDAGAKNVSVTKSDKHSTISYISLNGQYTQRDILGVDIHEYRGKGEQPRIYGLTGGIPILVSDSEGDFKAWRKDSGIGTHIPLLISGNKGSDYITVSGPKEAAEMTINIQDVARKHSSKTMALLVAYDTLNTTFSMAA